MASLNRPSQIQIKTNRKSKNSDNRDTSESKGYKAIPKTIADRMARRVVITTGIPTILGMGVFVLSYFLVSRNIATIPPSLTLLVSGSCFLLALLGLTYGIISTSWEKVPGTILGFEHIRTNMNRLRNAMRE